MDLYQKFRAQEALARIPSGKIVAAVSGGADSVCLLHCLKRLSGERKWIPLVVHIQHGLRGKASIKDQAFVEDLARKWSLAFEAREIRPPASVATEEKSRILRYHQLGEAARKFGAAAILTAHNANDQAETFFLNILRGSGADGLCGMPEERPLSELTREPAHKGLRLLRPLLSFSRRDIESYLRSQGLGFRTDRTNLSLKYRRNWVRHKLIPLMEKAQPRLVERISELARILRDQRAFLSGQVRAMEKNGIRWEGDPPGERLDIGRFFEYNQYLRQYFLHRLRPESSYREIGEMVAFLSRRKNAETISLP